MSGGSTHPALDASALEARRRRLAQAAKFAEMHCAAPLFAKRMRRPGAPDVMVRFEWPGVLRVYELATGEILAESLPGRPDKLTWQDGESDHA